MFLQPGAGDFQQYAELTNPYPLVSPSWANQYIDPKYDPAFNVTLRYMPTASDDFALDWTHLRATDVRGAKILAIKAAERRGR